MHKCEKYEFSMGERKTTELHHLHGTITVELGGVTHKAGLAVSYDPVSRVAHEHVLSIEGAGIPLDRGVKALVLGALVSATMGKPGA